AIIGVAADQPRAGTALEPDRADAVVHAKVVEVGDGAVDTLRLAAPVLLGEDHGDVATIAGPARAARVTRTRRPAADEAGADQRAGRIDSDVLAGAALDIDRRLAAAPHPAAG